MANVAMWTAHCVGRGYISHAPPDTLDRTPVRPPSMGWTEQEVQRYYNFAITFEGRTA
jgi:hypothetical protein